MIANDLNENKKDLSHEEKIAQTSTQGLYTPSPISTQFLALQASHKDYNLNLKACQIAIKKLNKIKTEKIEAAEFLIKIREAFNVEEPKDSNYISHKIGKDNYVLRLSNHCVNSYFSNRKTIETSIVINLSEHEFVSHKDRLVKEYVYYPENLTKEVKDNIIKGLTDWVNTGTYSYNQADKINMSDDMIKLEMRKAERAQFVQNKLSEAGIDVVTDKNEFDAIISEKADGKKMTQGSKIYGFSYQGKIYLNSEIATSETPLHEYTHLWDNYIQNTNPELWEKGKNILRNTKFWEEVKADPNYAEIAEDEDLLLSEVHAQICGKMADAILAKIQEQDGELTKNTVIDWNNETWAYIVQEFGLENLWNNETKETLENLKEFLSKPMKDLFENTEKLNINVPRLSETERQQQAVREMYHDTEMWLKAPNGKPTNLTEEQWIAVRTPNFKRWFGNWDYDDNKIVKTVEMNSEIIEFNHNNASEVEKWLKENLTGKSVIINSSGAKVLFFNKGLQDSLKRHGEIQRNAYTVLEELISKSELFDFAKKDDKEKHKGIAGQDIYYSALKVGDKYYSVKFKFDVSEKYRTGSYKDHKITEIKTAPLVYHGSKDAHALTGAIHDFTISQLTGGVKPGFSKVIDENGEPLVVYHSTSESFDTFKGDVFHFGTKAQAELRAEDFRNYLDDEINTRRNIIEKAANRTDVFNASIALEEAEKKRKKFENPNMLGVFLNIRNIKREYDEGGNWSEKAEQSKLEKYDGLVYYNNYENDGNDSYAVFNPNQIKSATDNNGNFDLKNDSILFQIIGQKERNVALINKTQGERTMPGEKQIIAEIGFADGEIRQYEDSVPFLKDLNEATRENAYDTNFRVYADSDELKQKAADVKLDNYDPIEAAERMHNGYEWNDVEHEAVQFTQSAEGRRLLKDAENGRLTMLDARDILDAVEKNGMTLRYDPLPNSYVVDGWTAADGEKLDNYVVSMSELKRLAGIEISENSQQNQIKKGNLEYIDEKRSREWAVRQRLQLPPLTDILGYSPNLTTKEDFVNSQKSLSKKRNVAHEEAPTQGDKSMPGEKKELSFSEQVDLVLAGKYNRFDALKVCDTPDLLLQSGLKQLPMLYTQRHLREAIQQKDLHNHTHGIKIEQIKSLPELIKNPVMIYDSLSRSESLLVLTSEIDVDKMPIVVSIRPNGKGTYELKKVDSNFITSMYGRENFEQHINSVVNNGKIIYWNKEKSQALFSVLGQRLPKGLNNLDPYKILHQTNSVVNTQFQTRTTEQETPTIKNNNEKSQERHSDAKDYLIQTTRLFLSKLKEKNLPFLRGKERGPNIIIRPQAARDAATGKAFTGYTQLMAQALIQALYDQKKLPELEYDLITYDQAKACGTFIKKGSPHITLTNYNRTTNSASKQMYYFKSGCNSPEMIDLHKESIARNRAIKRIRQSLENKEIPSERQTEEKNKITLLHYEEMTYLKALNKDTEQYFDSLTAEEKEMLKTLCSKEPLTQKTVKELAETLRKDRLISAQLSSQKNSGRSFDATECIVPEDFIGKAMAAASLGCSLETTQGTIDRITKDLHQTLSRNIEHYDYGKPFETGEIINGKCRNNVKDMCNKEYEAEELAKKIEQQQMALKKNPINALMELLNRNDLSDRTIGGYER